jgi:flagellar motor switch protein FliM
VGVTTVPDVQPAPDPSAVTPRQAGGRGRRGGASTGPLPYDFRRPTKLSREHARTLQIVFETFARQYATQLTSTLRAVGTVHLLTVEQLTYDEYVTRLNNPTVMNLLSVEPLPGVGVLEISLGSAMIMVDHLLGGHGGVAQPERPLSEIEMALLRGLLERGLGELRYAFEGVVPLEPTIFNVEYNPQFAQAATPSEMVLVATFEQKIGEHDSALTVCLPFNPIFTRLESAAGMVVTSERERLMREAARAALTRRLEDVPVDVAVRFSSSGVPSGDLANLQIGDVLPLRHNLSAPLSVTAADVVFAHAVPGSQGKRLAVLVVDPPEEEPRR